MTDLIRALYNVARAQGGAQNAACSMELPSAPCSAEEQ